MSKSYFDEFYKMVEKGMAGENLGIPTGCAPIDNDTNGIQSGLYTLIGGGSGTGKSALVDLFYVLNPYDWLNKNAGKTKYKLKIIYNSMERPIGYKIAKWVCLKLYQDYKIIIDVPTVLGWRGKKRNLTEEDRIKIVNCREYIDTMLTTVVDIYAGAENPTGIYNRAVEYLKSVGTVDHSDRYKPRYVPNDPNLIVLVINDHIGKLKTEKGYSDKQILDKHSEYMGILRDFYGCSIVDVNQFNRGIENIERFKSKELSPEPSDFKGSGDVYENADVVFGLFNPYKLKVNDFLEYDIPKFVAPNAENRFRSLSVIKNSYGPDDVIYGLNFCGEIGHFRVLPSAEKMNRNPAVNYKKAKDYS